jgi:redox-sensitive bicupin YhaK (pirin superfamily)
MIHLRKAQERGHADHGWLDTYHTFSFAGYYDPAHMGFRSLRVINEDRVQPGQGFGTHGHRDMEIITYVLEGSLEHKDSLGTGSVIQPGELQRMTAGTGVLHSEFNPSVSDLAHFYQIWLLPARKGLAPSYEQRRFPDDAKRGRFQLVASPDRQDGSLSIQQDARLYLANVTDGETLAYPLEPGRHAWLQVVRGQITLAGQPLAAGDGAALSDVLDVEVQGRGKAEVMLFDLA